MAGRSTLTKVVYPELNARPTKAELDRDFTPADEELRFAANQTRQPGPRLALLVYLKTLQRLGYFVSMPDIPLPIIKHIAAEGHLTGAIAGTQEMSTQALQRLRDVAREYVVVLPYDSAAENIAKQAAWQAALTRDDIPDIINPSIEELLRHRYELPELSTLTDIAKQARSQANANYHRVVAAAIGDRRHDLDELLRVIPGDTKSRWDQVKMEPGRATQGNLQSSIIQVRWLREHVVSDALKNIPEQKLAQFAAEGRVLDASDLSKTAPNRRYTLMAAVLRARLAENLDGMASMFIKMVRGMHTKAEKLLFEQREKQAADDHELISLLHATTLAWGSPDTLSERASTLDNTLLPNKEDIIAKCEAHNAVATNNYRPFLKRLYSAQLRSIFFRFLEEARPESTSQNQTLIHAIDFIIEHRSSKKPEVNIGLNSGAISDARRLDLSFVPDAWWALVAGQKSHHPAPLKVDRVNLELCVFSMVMEDLRILDLHIPGALEFEDYRRQLISEEEAVRLTPQYAEQAGFPDNGPDFVENLKTELHNTATEVDGRYPDNHYVSIINGKPKVERLKGMVHAGSAELLAAIQAEMPEISISRPFVETEQWMNWSRCFGPLTGYDNKLDKPQERYVTCAFGYGCGLGPTQTARSVKGIDRKQISTINARHITEDDLDRMNRILLDYYAKLDIHKYWGTGQSASADGMKWETHPQTLMTEFHIRYGGYGGIGYYMVSDTYIALFSRFIACGSYEGHNILDFIHEAQKTAYDESLRPTTIHSDTHGQNTAIFALAYLLGIMLMPRIKDWKDLHFCRAGREFRYEHIDDLFNASVDWDLIEEHFPDMMRVALSIKAGKLLPSTILRRLASYSHKNKLYQAFDQLGRVVRTNFLLKYLDSVDLRRVIGVATNKSERWNKFLRWINFGGRGLIAEVARDEQRKFIKYNRNAGNILVVHTSVLMTAAMDRLLAKGKEHLITPEAMAGITPYLVEHIAKFGEYEFDMEVRPATI